MYNTGGGPQSYWDANPGKSRAAPALVGLDQYINSSTGYMGWGTVPSVSEVYPVNSATGYMGWGSVTQEVGDYYGEEPSSGGSGGGGYGGYGGGSPSKALENLFIDWFGYVPQDLLKTARDTGWTEDNIRRAALKDSSARGALLIRARANVKQTAALWYADPSDVPQSVIDGIIYDGLQDDQDYLKNVYFPSLNGVGATNPAAKPWVDSWTESVGGAMTVGAQQKLSEVIGAFGFTQDAMNAFESWVQTTPEAIMGNYGAKHRVDIAMDFNQYLGRNPTQAELDPNGSYWNLDQYGRYEAIKATPDYQAIYAGKPAYMTESQYLDYAHQLSSVYTWYYGSDFDVTTLRGSTVQAPTVPMTTDSTQTPVGTNVPVTTQATPQWKSLTTDQFAQDLKKYGIDVVGSGPGGTYTKDGKTISWDDLQKYLPTSEYYKDAQGYHYVQEPGAAKPGTVASTKPQWKSLSTATFAQELAKVGITAEGSGSSGVYRLADGSLVAYKDLVKYLPSGEFYYDNQGYHYVQDYGAVNPKTGQPALITKPQQIANPDTTNIYPETQGYSAGLAALGITNVTSSEVQLAIASGLSPADIKMLFQAHEEAIYLEGAYGKTLQEAYGSIGFSHDDWEALARGGQGSGAMRVKLMEAQNRVAFREVWRDYFGTDPGPGDYDYVTENFVSPGEFAKRMAAKESAKSKIDEVNELMQRVYGTTVSLSDLENLAMGGKDSGILQAQITQAEKLDQYRWIYKQYYDREPTPEDYAGFLGYSGPQELQWEIVTTERIAEFRDDVNDVWAATHDGQVLTEDQLWTLYGEQEGYGSLRAELKKAQEQVEDEERSIREAHTAPKFSTWYAAGKTGAFKEAMEGLADIGA